METTKITVTVELTVESDNKLTENDIEQVVAELDYNFSFSEVLDENKVKITDTEITETM